MPDDQSPTEWPPDDAPWHAHEKLQGSDDQHPGACEVYGSDGDLVALVFGNLAYERTVKERAALVAALPELVAKARGLVEASEAMIDDFNEEKRSEWCGKLAVLKSVLQDLDD
jgi:hypothetical protein